VRDIRVRRLLKVSTLGFYALRQLGENFFTYPRHKLYRLHMIPIYIATALTGQKTRRKEVDDGG
jgi:hypothetical protein